VGAAVPTNGETEVEAAALAEEEYAKAIGSVNDVEGAQWRNCLQRSGTGLVRGGSRWEILLV